MALGVQRQIPVPCSSRGRASKELQVPRQKSVWGLAKALWREPPTLLPDGEGYEPRPREGMVKDESVI